MFDNKDIEAYRNIKVPSELKTKILADQDAEETKRARIIGGAFPTQRLIRSLSAIAACLVRAVAIFSVARMNTTPVTVSYEGIILSEGRVDITPEATLATLEPRVVTPIGIPLSFCVEKSAEIMVDSGSLYRVSDDYEDVENLGEKTVIDEDTVLWWAVIGGSETYELTVTVNGKATVYVLEMNDLTPNGVIYKK